MQTSGIAYRKMWSTLGREDEGTVTTYKSIYICKQINICKGWHMELRIEFAAKLLKNDGCGFQDEGISVHSCGCHTHRPVMFAHVPESFRSAQF